MKYVTLLFALLVTSHALAEDAAVAASSLPTLSLSAVSAAPEGDDLGPAPGRGRLIQHHGFYVAPAVGVTTLNDDVAPLIAMRAAWLANRSFGVGLAVNAVANEFDEKLHYKGRALSAYGGLLLQYVIGSTRLLHGFIETTVGGGRACLQTGIEGSDTGKDDCGPRHGFFMLEPMANLEINVSSFMRVSLGVGYRVAAAGSASEISSKNLGGFVSKTALEFGRF